MKTYFLHLVNECLQITDTWSALRFIENLTRLHKLGHIQSDKVQCILTVYHEVVENMGLLTVTDQTEILSTEIKALP
jgi:hypothetical protein